MTFNSLTYIIFLTFMVVVYWVLPRRFRLWLIFVASILFYGFWRWQYVILMVVSVITDYIVALRMDKVKKKQKKLLLLSSLLINFGLLVYFKYLLFFADCAVSLLNVFGMSVQPPGWSIILPLGISFYTFQTVSYSIDVYRGICKPEKDFILFGCYVTFFPQLVAGPILRAGDVVCQLSSNSPFNVRDIAIGLRRVIAGLFLKVVMADNIAGIIDEGFSQNPEMLRAPDVWTLAILFGFQIYLDFSAYSHIAIGSARLLGIKFPENFHFPYFAVSPRDFWKRWHISLSSWIRDYLYLPLCGKEVKQCSKIGAFSDDIKIRSNRKTAALFITWAIMGLWHGAAWSFVLWGLIHAALIYLHRMIIEKITAKISFGGFIGWCTTVPFVMLAWISFRAQSLNQTLVMYDKVFTPSEYFGLGLRENTYVVAVLMMICVFSAWLVKNWLMPFFQKRTWYLVLSETPVFAVALVLIFIFLRPVNQFIYFQF